MNESVVLIIGGNLGNRLSFIHEAKVLLIQQLGPIVLSSKVYETEAWGGVSQSNFLNQVLVFQTHYSPQELLLKIHAIEHFLGRERNEKWGDRTMDIDILYYGDQIIDEKELSIPHPKIPERRFVLIPLVEILPDFVHPIYKKNHHELLANCDDSCKVKVLES
jgi:2-amino-4-hydroxy-6-hydroxymethyldihydropteridine diphosphokinase